MRYAGEHDIVFAIEGQGGRDLDWICIERKTKGKHKDKACWSSGTQYKASSIPNWIYKLWDFGFDTSEFEKACIEMGWEKEVEKYLKEQDDLTEKESGDGEHV